MLTAPTCSCLFLLTCAIICLSLTWPSITRAQPPAQSTETSPLLLGLSSLPPCTDLSQTITFQKTFTFLNRGGKHSLTGVSTLFSKLLLSEHLINNLTCPYNPQQIFRTTQTTTNSMGWFCEASCLQSTQLCCYQQALPMCQL